MSGSQTISFKEIPADYKTPGSYVEIAPDYQRVGLLPMPARTLIIGQKTSAGSATALTLNPDVTRASAGTALGGPGSQLDGMIAAYLAVNQTVPLDVIAMADAGSSTKAVWTYTFTGPATAGGTTAIQIAGWRVYIGTLSGDSATVVATAFTAAINAKTALPVTATSSAGVVTVTARNAGTAGNDISHVVSPALGDVLPAGVGVTIAQTVVGATDPDIVSAIAAIEDLWYTDIIIPWQNSANLTALSVELDRRFNAMVHKDGRGHICLTGTYSQLLTKAGAVNGRFMFASGFTAPGSPPWVIAASVGGLAAQHLLDDPARQLLDLALPGVIGSQRGNLFDDDEKHLLISGGVSIFKTLRDGTVVMQRCVSTYTVNANGVLDPAWRDITGVAVLSRMRYDWRGYFRDIYPANKLAPDSSLAAESDSTICTPRRAGGTWAARSIVYARNGWIVDEVENARATVFVIDPNDRNRLNYRLHVTIIGNLMVDAGQLLFAA